METAVFSSCSSIRHILIFVGEIFNDCFGGLSLKEKFSK